MDKKLVRMVGRSDAVGKPMLYGTTKEFLELFGLPSLKEMPPLQEIEDMLPKNEVGEAEDEENRIRGELQAIVERAEILGFADIEQEEMRLFQNEAQVELNDESETKSRKEVSHAARAERSEEGEDSSRRAESDDTATQISEAGETQLQQDEVAGAISFGSISATQEAEWESNEPVRREVAAQGDDAVAGSDAETPEGDLERRHNESTQS
jgi:segregation and condensation protein B